MHTILCYGDSNTFGTNPGGGRWGIDQRWTGLLGSMLGGSYRIIEEGLGGRTTVFDDPLEPKKNGLEYLFRSHCKVTARWTWSSSAWGLMTARASTAPMSAL